MTYDLIIALSGFAFVALITPGPNNLMLMASGMNYGFARTIPHMFGIWIGFSVMILLVGGGLMQVFDAVPHSYLALKVVSASYLLFLAWKIATAAPMEKNGTSSARPLSFLQAATFQWVNPKAWAMALTAITVYAPPSHPVLGVIIVATTFAIVGSGTLCLWTALGQQLRRFLTDPLKQRVFNMSCALLLVASLSTMLGMVG